MSFNPNLYLNLQSSSKKFMLSKSHQLHLLWSRQLRKLLVPSPKLKLKCLYPTQIKTMSLNNSTMVHITIKMKLVKVKTRILKFNCHLLRQLNLLLKSKCCGSQDKKLTKIIRQVLAPLMKIIMKLFRTTTDMLHQQ